MKTRKVSRQHQYILTRIGKKIKQLRQEKDLSYPAMAEKVGLSKVTYFKLEKGSNFQMRALLMVLDYHHITLEDFFKDI